MNIPKFEDGQLESICEVLGDTGGGLAGSEIAKIFAQCNIDDVDPTITKRHRLFAALRAKQVQDRCANNVISFIQKAMAPNRYLKNQEVFEARRKALNLALSFAGFDLKENGKVVPVNRVETLSEANKRASKLKHGLEHRSVHPQILRFCQEQLVQENYFHAVFEAAKSIAERIREMTGLKTDGAELIDDAFKIDHPLLIVNNLSTDTEKSEQKGLVNFIKGILGMFRNTTAHAPKIKWEIGEKDALEILSAMSLVHRKLDVARRTSLQPK